MLTDILGTSANPWFPGALVVVGYAENGDKAYGHAMWERDLEISTPYYLRSLSPWKEMPSNEKINEKKMTHLG